MCTTCGCSAEARPRVTNLQAEEGSPICAGTTSASLRIRMLDPALGSPHMFRAAELQPVDVLAYRTCASIWKILNTLSVV
jgi:hypothetical protein